MKAKITVQDRKRLARELVIGAPVAGLLWLLLLRLFIGEWSFAFPLLIVGFSVLLSILMMGPEAVGIPAYRFWKTLVFAIDWVVTRIVCFLLYYLLITPVGLVFKLLRKPLLEMRPDPEEPSQWRKVSPANEKRRQYFRQY